MADNKNWENFWEDAEQKVVNKSKKFAIQPVSSEIFFRDWLKSPLFPRQQKAVSAAFNNGHTMLSDKFNEFVLAWGKGCLHKNTLLKDEITQEVKSVEQFAKEKKAINIKTCETYKDANNIIRYKDKIVKSGIPFKAGKAKLYRVTLESEKTVVVSAEHKFKTKNGWVTLSQLKKTDKILVNDSPKENMSATQETARRDKISKSMLNVSKTKEHKENIKNSSNSGRFEKGHTTWNKGIERSQSVKNKISEKLLGTKLSKETKQKMALINKGMKNHKKDCSCAFCKAMRGEWLGNVFKYKNIKMRSSWEVAFARYLDAEELTWEYEKHSFTFKNGKTYIPDFYIKEHNKFIEIKSFCFRDSKEKTETFKEEFDVNYEVLRKNDLIKLGVL